MFFDGKLSLFSIFDKRENYCQLLMFCHSGYTHDKDSDGMGIGASTLIRVEASH